MMLKSKILLYYNTVIWVNLLSAFMYKSITWIQVSLQIIFGFLNKFVSLLLEFFDFVILFIKLFFLFHAVIETITRFCLLFSQSEVFDLLLSYLFLWLFYLECLPFTFSSIIMVEFHGVIQCLIFFLVGLLV